MSAKFENKSVFVCKVPPAVAAGGCVLVSMGLFRVFVWLL